MKVYPLMAYHPTDGSGPPRLRSVHRSVESAKAAADIIDGSVELQWKYFDYTRSWTNGFFSVGTDGYELED